MGEPALGALGTANHAIEVWADPVRLALPESMAGGAFFCPGIAPFFGRTRQPLRDRLIGGRRGAAPGRRLLGHHDVKARLCRLHGVKHRLCRDVEREQAQAGEQERTQDLVEFERVHCVSGSWEAGNSWESCAGAAPYTARTYPV